MKLRYILIIGILIRLCIMPFFAHPYDMQSWHQMSEKIVEGVSPTSLWPTPVWAYTMFPVAHLNNWVSTSFNVGPMPIDVVPPEARPPPEAGVTYIPGPAFNFILKSPILIFDVLVAFIVYEITSTLMKKRKLAEKAALLWFLNPCSIWISGAWGMMDSLPVLFTLASVFFILKKRVELSSFCLALAVGSKLYPILLLVPITVFLLKTSKPMAKRINFAKFYLIFGAATFILFLPYLPRVGSYTASLVGVTTTGSFTFGLTYWSILHYAPTLIGVASYASVGIFVALLAVVSWKISKFSFKRKPSFDLVAAMFACILVIYLSVVLVCPQYFMWALPFIVILYVSGRIHKGVFWVLSIMAFLFCILHCALPYFMLPMAPWIGNELVWMVNTLGNLPIAVFLVIFGVLFSVLFSLLLLELVFKRPGLLKTFTSYPGKSLRWVRRRIF